jgi:alpha-galactosidase
VPGGEAGGLQRGAHLPTTLPPGPIPARGLVRNGPGRPRGVPAELDERGLRPTWPTSVPFVRPALAGDRPDRHGRAMAAEATPTHLRAGGVSVVLDLSPDGPPAVLHGAPTIGPLEAEELRALAADLVPAPTNNTPDTAVRVLGAARGQHRVGRPAGVCSGTAPATPGRPGSPPPRTRWRAGGCARGAPTRRPGSSWTSSSSCWRPGCCGCGPPCGPPPRRFALDRLDLALPVPPVATELLDQAGRWARELGAPAPPDHHRHPPAGEPARAHRAGTRRPCCSPGRRVPVRRGRGVGAARSPGAATTWSWVERSASGSTLLGGGELLLPGEVTVTPDEPYTSPWLYATHGAGWTRRRRGCTSTCGPGPGTRAGRAPVVLNTWEASTSTTTSTGCSCGWPRWPPKVGVERYVLDDGWFLGRRDDTAGLGDWVVDPDVWPTACTRWRPGARAGHAVRAVGGAGDDQPDSGWPGAPRSGSCRPATGCR